MNPKMKNYRSIAETIISSLKDRSGLFELDDDEIEEEIIEEITNIIKDNL